ncbi:hypothetical protein F5Y16DRAFT_370208 [Xylariaceae sp. FL0255]|nr:hypothetical protein F5Y16DRAFT_370208 [Xylariaceae sp. FL0255]
MSAPQETSNQGALRTAEEELQRRRERARLSQARFRKRQGEAAVELRQENKRLKDAIAEVVRNVHNDDRAALLQAVQAAANVAGLELSSLAPETQTGDKGTANETTKTGSSAISSTETVPLQQTTQTQSSYFTVNEKYPAPKVKNCEAYTAVMLSAAQAAKEIHQQAGSRPLSPRLDYGIWLDSSRALKVQKAPEEIVPYMGAGQYTFSGQLYWACGEYISSLCRIALRSYPSSSASWFRGVSASQKPNAHEAERRIQAILQHDPPISSLRLALALVEAHSHFRDQGFVVGDSPLQAGTMGLLRTEFESRLLTMGDDIAAWLDIAQVEVYMRMRLGDEAFARLNRVMIAHASPDGVGAEVQADPLYHEHGILKMLIKGLAESYTCFGDGPRWRSDAIATMLSFSDGVNTVVA